MPCSLTRRLLRSSCNASVCASSGLKRIAVPTSFASSFALARLFRRGWLLTITCGVPSQRTLAENCHNAFQDGGGDNRCEGHKVAPRIDGASMVHLV